MSHWYLIYDDKCEICNVGISKVRKLDKSHLIELVPLSNPVVPSHIKLPSKDAMQKHMYLISPDGKIYKGVDALAELLEIFPESRMASRVAAIPFMKPMARLLYSLLAKHRMKLSKLISSH